MKPKETNESIIAETKKVLSVSEILPGKRSAKKCNAEGKYFIM
jgi:hypothetical protein